MVRWKGEGKDFAKVGVVKGTSTVVWSLRQILLWFMLKAMSASFKMAKDADEAMSESSWTALAKGKERGWWSIDLEGETEKLEVMARGLGLKADLWIPKERWNTGQLEQKLQERKVRS